MRKPFLALISLVLTGSLFAQSLGMMSGKITWVDLQKNEVTVMGRDGLSVDLDLRPNCTIMIDGQRGDLRALKREMIVTVRYVGRGALNGTASEIKATSPAVIAKKAEEKEKLEMLQRGKVLVANQTDLPFVFAVTRMKNDTGNLAAGPPTTWTLKPGEQEYLKVDGNEIMTSYLEGTLRTLNGMRPFAISHPNPGKDFVLIVTPTDLPRSVQIARNRAFDQQKDVLGKLLLGGFVAVLGVGGQLADLVPQTPYVPSDDSKDTSVKPVDGSQPKGPPKKDEIITLTGSVPSAPAGTKIAIIHSGLAGVADSLPGFDWTAYTDSDQKYSIRCKANTTIEIWVYKENKLDGKAIWKGNSDAAKNLTLPSP